MEDVRLERAPFFPFPIRSCHLPFQWKSLVGSTFDPVRSAVYFPEWKLALNRAIRYASAQNRFWRVTLSTLFPCFYNTVQLLFVSPYNHLLFLAKSNKENDNNIDFLLSKERINLKKYSSILDQNETKQRLLFKLFKQRKRMLLLVFNKFQYIGKNVTCFHGDSNRHDLPTERTGQCKHPCFLLRSEN